MFFIYLNRQSRYLLYRLRAIDCLVPVSIHWVAIAPLGNKIVRMRGETGRILRFWRIGLGLQRHDTLHSKWIAQSDHLR